MTTRYCQLRGSTYFQEINSDGSLKQAFAICPDALSITMGVLGQWDHTNMCGPTDVIDASGNTGYSAGLTFSFSNMEDKLFAFGALGIVNPAGDPGTVTDEELPGDLADGDVWFLGGKTRHRNITALVISGMTLTDDYTLDPVSGKVTFVGDQSASPAPTAAYGYSDPQFVSMLNAPVKNYFVSYEFQNRQDANAPGSEELYKVRMDPASTIDFMSAKQQDMSLKGVALADIDRPPDGELGQFGRRVL